MMRKLLAGIVVGGWVAFSLMLFSPAQATTGECQIFYNHSGHIPGSYDYAEFYEDGQLITTVQTNGEDVFVNPAGWDAGESWDQVNKCHNGTTTTLPEETTTTIAETSTTTVAENTTTSVDSSTTTTVGETTSTTATHGAFWDASSECQTLTAEWGEGITQVDVYQRIGEGDFGPADGVVPFTESGQVLSVESALPGSEWLLIPVVETGWVAVREQISLFTDVCETTTSSVPELPFTGPAGLVGLLIAGVATLGIGVVLVREFGSE